MDRIALPHNVWVLVGDGRKALVLRNEGDEKYPNLKAMKIFQNLDNPSTAQQGTDRPGRAIENPSGRRSGLDQTDWHVIGEQRFAREVADKLETSSQGGEFDALVIVAPPRTLSELRHAFTSPLRRKILAEVNRDLTRHPIPEIERLLTGAN